MQVLDGMDKIKLGICVEFPVWAEAPEGSGLGAGDSA